VQTHTNANMRPKVQLQPIPQTPPQYGIFEAHFNNAKRRAGRPLQHADAYGSLYPDGTVHLHTQAVPVADFVSIGELRDYLKAWGAYRIVWIAGPLAKVEEEM
jgi:hypothetical protein